MFLPNAQLHDDLSTAYPEMERLHHEGTFDKAALGKSNRFWREDR
jgi:hypothetical protein